MAATTRQTLLIAVSLMAVISVATRGGSVGQLRYKRNSLQLCWVIYKYTGRNCLDYDNYGCYCGYGTPTATPVDVVDRCCQYHDYCYDELLEQYNESPYVTTYDKDCEADSCRCTDSPGTFDFSLCSCDVRLGQCLQSAIYSQGYKDWDENRCRYYT